MAWLASGMATMAARVTVLLVVPLALATMVARVTALLVMLSLAPALLLLLQLPALVPVGTRARRPEQLTTRRTRQRHEASGLVRGQRQQQLPRLRGAVAVAAA